jgi:hypothetical protein
MSSLRAAALVGLIAAAAGTARAAALQLGTQDLSDQQVLGCFSPAPGCTLAWTGASDPFNRFSGSDPGIAEAADFLVRWSFDLSSIGPERPGAVRIELGLYDHDSAAPGSQLGYFLLNPGSTSASDLTGQLASLFEAPGIGEHQEYNVFGFDLPPSAVESLLSSSIATFELKLEGPALIKVQSGAIVPAEGTNGAGLDFVRLTLTGAATVPEPASALLAGLALAALAVARTRAK